MENRTEQLFWVKQTMYSPVAGEWTLHADAGWMKLTALMLWWMKLHVQNVPIVWWNISLYVRNVCFSREQNNKHTTLHTEYSSLSKTSHLVKTNLIHQNANGWRAAQQSSSCSSIQIHQSRMFNVIVGFIGLAGDAQICMYNAILMVSCSHSSSYTQHSTRSSRHSTSREENLYYKCKLNKTNKLVI